MILFILLARTCVKLLILTHLTYYSMYIFALLTIFTHAGQLYSKALADELIIYQFFRR